MTDFLAQGGYAFYVWTSYAVSAAALAAAVVWSIAGRRKARRALERLEKRNGH